MSSNLIIARCGASSLHETWLEGPDRDFDFIATFYGEEVPAAWRPDRLDYSIVPIPGGKWKGLFAYLAANESWRGYDRILLPDDDLLFDAATISAFFKIAEELGADLAQPALDDASYFSHPVTLRHASFRYRRTNFVELMCPCFSRRMLEKTLPLFAESESGWGMDAYWTDMLGEFGYEPPLIIDETPVRHTRPVGSAGHGVSGKARPKAEMRSFRAARKLKKAAAVTQSGVLVDGRVTSPAKGRLAFLRTIARDLCAHRRRMKAKLLRGSLLAHAASAFSLATSPARDRAASRAASARTERASD